MHTIQDIVLRHSGNLGRMAGRACLLNLRARSPEFARLDSNIVPFIRQRHSSHHIIELIQLEVDVSGLKVKNTEETHLKRVLLDEVAATIMDIITCRLQK